MNTIEILSTAELRANVREIGIPGTVGDAARKAAMEAELLERAADQPPFESFEPTWERECLLR